MDAQHGRSTTQNTLVLTLSPDGVKSHDLSLSESQPFRVSSLLTLSDVRLPSYHRLLSKRIDVRAVPSYVCIEVKYVDRTSTGSKSSVLICADYSECEYAQQILQKKQHLI